MTVDPVALVLIPFLGALVVALIGQFKPELAKSVSITFAAALLLTALATFEWVASNGSWQYFFGGWLAPYGIEFRVTSLSAAFAVIISLVYLCSLLMQDRAAELIDRRQHGVFYSLLSLTVVGLMGLVISADIFNIYVFLEISSLTSYALIALAGGRALVASFQYLLLGSIGACFYLLGVGYLYIKTGTLNLADLAERIEPVLFSSSVTIGFLFILLGMMLKMGVFPLHTWLPNCYSSSLPIVSNLLAPLATKAAAIVLLKISWQVIGVETIWSYDWSYWINVLVSIGIILAGCQLLSEKRLLYVFSYLIVMEMGYIVAGLFTPAMPALQAAAFHVLADSLMMAVLFSAIAGQCNTTQITFDHLSSMVRQAPLSVLALILAMLSMLGVPLTIGFISKWYFIGGAIVAQQWAFLAALLFSSIVTFIVLARVIEGLWFKTDTIELELEHRSFSAQMALLILLVTLVVAGYFGPVLMEKVVVEVFIL